MTNPVQVSFQLPTQNTDGSALPAGDIVDIKLLWGTVKGGPYPNTYADKSLTPNAAGVCTLALTALNLPATDATYYMVAVTDANDGMTSAQTGEVSFTYNAAVPNPPAGLTVA